MFEKLLHNWFEIKHQDELDILSIFGSSIECSDERGVYYIESLYFDEDNELCGWCTDIDGDLFEQYNIIVPKEAELKLINWFTNNA